MEGIVVLLGRMGGNEETVKAYQLAKGKTIAKLALADDNVLRISFDDGSAIAGLDNGQSCCESRYMRTDDTLSDYEGAVLNDIEITEAPDVADRYGAHEVQFFRLLTSKGTVTFSNHNEHNGYYGGFHIVLRVTAGGTE